MTLIKFYPDDGSRGPIVVNQDRIDGITEEYGKAIIHAGSLKFRVRQSQKEVCEMLQQCVIASDMEAHRQPQIVRCKDCAYRGDPKKCILAKYISMLPDRGLADLLNTSEWFCADGKPMEMEDAK